MYFYNYLDYYDVKKAMILMILSHGYVILMCAMALYGVVFVRTNRIISVSGCPVFRNLLAGDQLKWCFNVIIILFGIIKSLMTSFLRFCQQLKNNVNLG